MTEQAVAGIRCFDHAVLPVMDLWRAERFYTEVLDGAMFQKVGMNYRPPPAGSQPADLFIDPPGAFVKLGRSHIGLFLQTQVPVQPPADVERALPCLGLAVAEGASADLVQRVRAAGGAVGQEATRTLGPISWRGVRCADSEGNCLELVATAAALADRPQVLGLHHLQAETCDLAATGAFYVDVLGLDIAAEGPGWLALAVPGGQYLVFHAVQALSPAMVGPYFGRHFAFHVDDDSFHAIVGRLRAAGIAEGDALGRNVPGEYATYFYDPNGLWLQVLNHDSAQAVSGRVLMRYTPVELGAS
jgi:catechol 2,3-dioxygenase-like lactoylglutathione lyase family enzyme